MVTKWKRFSSNRFVKAAAVVLFVICFGAVGMIAGYLPAFSYVKGSEPYGGFGGDALLADSFAQSGYLEYSLWSDYNEAYDIISSCISSTADKELCEPELARLPYYVDFNIWESNGTNSTEQPYFSISVSKSHIECSDDNVVIGDNQSFKSAMMSYHRDEHIKIGYTREQYKQKEAYWLEMRRNMQIVVASEIVLIVIGIGLLVFICCGVGKSADGTVTYKRVFRTFYEITLCFIGAMVFVMVCMISGYNIFIDLCSTANGRLLYIIISGVLSALLFMMVLYLAVCISVRIKNKTAIAGSLLAHLFVVLRKVLIFIGKVLVRFFRCVKELFTGELYSTGTAAKKLMLMDIAMLVVSTVILPFVGIAINDQAGVIWVVLLIVEFILLSCFFCGRYYILRDGAVLEEQIKKMHSGDYSNSERTLAKNSPYRKSSEKLSEMSTQYRHGIEESIKAERMKIDLVTNVSHDLKTPLTSIIGYIELLSKEPLTGDAAEYVAILSRKSERLKNIVSDVFELAKTTSGEITVEREPLDLTKLSYQALGEMQDRIEASEFDVKVKICDPPVTVISDGKRLYRIIQNLLDNALKYSLRGTRIYYSLEQCNNDAVITIKNIAAYEMTFTKEEILERFTRGDKARSTEGSGLGLSIAQGFALACGGKLDIDIDGDMFKAIVTFPVVSAAGNTSEEE